MYIVCSLIWMIGVRMPCLSCVERRVRLYFVERLGKVGDDVVDVLRTYRQANGRRCDVLQGQFVGRKLRVRGAVGMYHEALYVGYVGQKREYLQRINKSPCFFLSALNFEGEDACSSLWVETGVELVVGMRRKGRVVHLCHFGMMAQEVDHAQSEIGRAHV